LTEDGFAAFFQQRFSWTVVLLIAMGASRADAEDATQEAMFLAWRQGETVREPAAWVRTVAVRAYWKQVRARRLTDSFDESLTEVAGDSDLSIFAEEQQQVLRLLRGLPKHQQTVAALFYDGLACEEIADLIGKPASTVRSLLRYARQNLKGMMLSAGF
jgi:RNA polymerase sigma factor (sigma-70 family)